MRIVISLLALLLIVALSTLGQSKSSSMGQADPAATSPLTESSGCLQGTSGAYRLVRADGTVHLLMGDDEVLKGHVGDTVTLKGYRDTNRDASASSDEGTAHGLRFFQVDGVATENSKCNQK